MGCKRINLSALVMVPLSFENPLNVLQVPRTIEVVYKNNLVQILQLRTFFDGT